MPGIQFRSSFKDAISDNQRVESGDWPVSLNSYCTSAGTSTVSSNAPSANNEKDYD